MHHHHVLPIIHTILSPENAISPLSKAHRNIDHEKYFMLPILQYAYMAEFIFGGGLG